MPRKFYLSIPLIAGGITIEHPAIHGLEVGKRGNQTMIVGLLEAWYDSKRLIPPSETQLTIYAKMILAVIEKNRAASS